MVVEKYTESLTLREMKCDLGKNDFGYVFPQGDITEVDKIEELLKKAGGKPKECLLDDYSKGGKGKAKPEYIITFDKNTNCIIVVECKNSVKRHNSKEFNRPNSYAVDGVLYYAKFLKEKYNVIAIAVSGTKKETMLVDTFHWRKGQTEYTKLQKAKDIILEPANYLKLVKGEKLKKEYSLEEIRETALDLHESLRQIKVSEKHKPIFIAGILIALENQEFSDEYTSCTTFKSVISRLNEAIEDILTKSDIKKDKINNVKDAFKIIGISEKLKAIPLGHKNSITWYIEQLELKIKPMMNYTETTIDALSIFYHEFVKYSGGADGRGLGIVLTPQHLTEFMCDVAEVDKNSRVLDICCGSGSFLVAAMSKMFKKANTEEIKEIKSKGLYGVELDPELFTLVVTNMIIRKDGKSNIYHGDCFNDKTKKELKTKNINIGLINPPYSQQDKCELEFVENMLDILMLGGTGVAVVPMSCAIGTKFKTIRARLFKKHTLKAVFSMPDDIFHPTGTNVCVMVWKAHSPHDTSVESFFGYYKEDGFVKRKKLGRIDSGKWNEISKQWLDLYRYNDVKDGLSARKAVTHNDEWLCEAYMDTDYSNLTQKDFEKTVREYYAYLVKSGDCYEIK